MRTGDPRLDRDHGRRSMAALSTENRLVSGVVPRVHRAALDNGLAGEDVKQLWRYLAGEAFRFDRGENGWDAEGLRHLGEEDDVVDEAGVLGIGYAEQHLRLVEAWVFRCISWPVPRDR